MRLHLARLGIAASVAFVCTAVQAQEPGPEPRIRQTAKSLENVQDGVAYPPGKPMAKMDARTSLQAQLFMEQKDAPLAQATQSEKTALRLQAPTRLSTKTKD